MAGTKTDTRDTPDTQLFRALRQGRVEEANGILDANLSLKSRDADGNTALMLAAHHSLINIVKRLVRDGAEVNAANICGDTPLKWAVAGVSSADNTETMRFLIRHGARVLDKNEHGITVLEFAGYIGRTELLDIFEEDMVASGRE